MAKGSNTFGGTIKLEGEAEYRKALSNINSSLRVVASEMGKVTAEFGKNDKSTESLTAKNEVLHKKLAEQEKQVDLLKKALDEASASESANQKNIDSWQVSLNKAEAELTKTKKEIDSNNDALKENAKSSKDSGKGVQEFGDKSEDASKSVLKLGDIIKANLISDAIKKGISMLANSMKQLGSTLIDVGKSAIKSYADYEQLIGGVETLFKESSGIVEQYANNAYKTAGLSANQYMETVTSFSASLLQSLDNDTAKVAEVSDMAITDMADNANKMGTSMESIQNAYQGFAKQNYTMLDNLKLGYGGTKTEMQRLLADAEKISGVKYDINNLSDVYNAIHVIQTELGITGTTAKEASTTIQGSMASLKSAWQNVLTGIADDNADFGMLIDNLLDSLVTAMDNLLPRIETALGGMMELIVQVAEKILPKMIEMGMNTIMNLVSGMNNNLPNLVQSVKTIVTTLINGITQIIPELIPVAVEIILTLVNTLIENLPLIIDCGIKMIISLIQGLAESIPTLIPTIVDAVMTIIETLIDNLDLLVDAGIQLLIAVAEGLIEALPRLIEKIPVIIDKLVNAIVNNLPKLIEAGITLILKLTEGIVKAIPQLLSKIPQLINSIVTGLANGIGKLMDVGKNLVQGLWNGINNAKQWVLDKIKGFGKAILNGIKSFFGIHSPSTVFRDQIGKYMAEGLGEGFTDEMENVSKEMQEAVPTTMDVGINATPNVLTQSTLTSNPSITNNDVVQTNLKDILADTLSNFIGTIELDNEKVGKFVIKTVAEEVYG